MCRSSSLRAMGRAPRTGSFWVTEVPPLRQMRRRSQDGAEVILDIARASSRGRPLAFGGGRRPCPGEDHALALAAGVLDVLLERCRVVPAAVAYAENPALRIPVRLGAVVL